MSEGQKVYIKSFGCQMNVYDSNRMADMLAPEGFAETAAPDDADLVILNTCHIREKAADKVYSEIGRIRLIKQAAELGGRRMVVAVAGCIAQAEGKEILRRASSVDLVVGPQSYHRLHALLARVERGEKVVDTEFPVEDKFSVLAPPSRAATRARGVSSFVTVQEGCDKFCTFCVVPYTRGAESSRPVARIIEEIERLADAGVREVTLIGQNVNAYHGEGPDGRTWSLDRLLYRIAEVPGIGRLRYTTSHPADMEPSLIAAHRDLGALMPFFHLPVQSGSDRILAVMNRKHDRSRYLEIVSRMRAVRPDIAFSTDFIVGFPTETEDEFGQTQSLVDEIGFASAFSFIYSSRPGTPAADMEGQVADTVKAERLQRLQQTIEHHRRAFNAKCVGRNLEVLFEKPGRHPGQLVGRSPYLQPVQVMAPAELIGEIRTVSITEVSTNSLFGSLAGSLGVHSADTRAASTERQAGA